MGHNHIYFFLYKVLGCAKERTKKKSFAHTTCWHLESITIPLFCQQQQKNYSQKKKKNVDNAVLFIPIVAFALEKVKKI